MAHDPVLGACIGVLHERASLRHHVGRHREPCLHAFKGRFVRVPTDVALLRLGALHIVMPSLQQAQRFLDKCSRRVVGWSSVTDAEGAESGHAGTATVSRLAFHSDRGAEYGAHAYRQRLATLGMVQSMNRPGA